MPTIIVCILIFISKTYNNVYCSGQENLSHLQVICHLVSILIVHEKYKIACSGKLSMKKSYNCGARLYSQIKKFCVKA